MNTYPWLQITHKIMVGYGPGRGKCPQQPLPCTCKLNICFLSLKQKCWRCILLASSYVHRVCISTSLKATAELPVFYNDEIFSWLKKQPNNWVVSSWIRYAINSHNLWSFLLANFCSFPEVFSNWHREYKIIKTVLLIGWQFSLLRERFLQVK